jgi:hypothetical protein
MSRIRLLRAAATAAAALAALLAAFSTPAGAAPAASTSTSQQITLIAAQHAQATQLSNIVVSYTGPAMNRSGCGTRVNPPQTPVISWKPDRDACEDAKIVQLTSMCGHGTVTSNCPFTIGLGLNNRYINRPIVAVQWYNEAATCLASDPSGFAVLGACPSLSGTGGSNGTIYIWSSSGYLVSRMWADYYHNGNPYWLCLDGGPIGDKLITDGVVAVSGDCQWDNAGIPGT